MPISGQSTATDASSQRPIVSGLYAVTPDWRDIERLVNAIEAVARGGAQTVQIRTKHPDRQWRLDLARAALSACRQHGARCIINDDFELAANIGADGVHLGRDDAGPAVAREALGDQAIIGVSCYDSMTRAVELSSSDYVAFGSVFASTVKPQAVRAPLALFTSAQGLGLNSVAIGGITRTNAAEVVAAGADALAVISDLFETDSMAEIEARARAFVRIIEQTGGARDGRGKS